MPMSDSPHKTAAYDFLNAHATVDEEKMLELMAPDAEMHMGKSAQEWVGMPEVIKGSEAIAAMLTARHGLHDGPAIWKKGFTWWDHDFAVEENDIVVIHTIRHSVTVQDKDYENPYVCIFRFEGPLIVELWEYLDSAYALSLVPKPAETTAAFRGELG
jgi:ketosteroid isomerase-like protein